MFTNRVPWIILLLVWMAGSTWWHVCKIKLLCADSPLPVESPATPAPKAVSSPVTIPPLVVNDGDQFQFNAAGNFSFAKSGAEANITGVASLADSVAAYLKANPGKTLIISGYYDPQEQNTTKFTSLGVARANAIKQLLQTKGLVDSLFVTTGVEKDDLVFSAKGDSLYGGIAFNFSVPTITATAATTTATPAETPAVLTLTEPTTEVELANKEKFTSLFEPLDLYFPLGEANYIKTEETSKFFKEAITYLAKNKGKKLILTGHTDNSGPDEVNRQLSRDRANAVKARLRKSGLSADQIKVDAKGEADPKADNSTLSGRKANRRVTVVVTD